MENFERHIAEGFVLHTNRNIFLTGKAGTGKTTFLHDIIQKTKKNTVVVAPTGVAAINAGGMTIHSMFQLPISSFVPNSDWVNPDIFTNRKELAAKQKIRKERRRLLIELELLVIDEISMVRSDLLDAVDFTLRRIRKNQKPFGGVQLLVIGDLFQLTPVMKEHEWSLLGKYYKSPFFFSSHAWEASSAITIELQKIYRQQDEVFITILNNIRTGVRNQADIDRLNENFNHKASAAEIITLTTHNRKARAINETELARLDTKQFKLKASVRGQFNESAYPTAENIILKEGAQVMLIRNHPDGLYYNGKIGVIEEWDRENETITLRGDDGNSILVESVEWKNTKYVLNESTNKIEPEEVGSFVQFPLRLAWAVTVHKSQGLTFDSCIVDLEDTFAPGQLYVALSRCRSLDGLSLSSMIRLENVIIDNRVKEHYDSSVLPEDIEDVLKVAKQEYEDINIRTAFDVSKLIDMVDNWREVISEKELLEKAKCIMLHKGIHNKLLELQTIAQKFEHQLAGLMKMGAHAEATDAILERGLKGVSYFTDEVYNKIITPLEEHKEKYRIKAKVRGYTSELKGIIAGTWTYVEELYKLEYRSQKIHPNDPAYKRVIYFNPHKEKGQKKPKREKGETQKITLELYQKGKTIKEIAVERGLVAGTIKGHLAKWVGEGKVPITDFMPEEKAKKILSYFEDNPDLGTAEVKAKIPFDTDYADLTMVRKWAELQKENEE